MTMAEELKGPALATRMSWLVCSCGHGLCTRIGQIFGLTVDKKAPRFDILESRRSGYTEVCLSGYLVKNMVLALILGA